MKFKAIKPILPELFIFGSVIYYWLASSLLNPIALGLIAILSYQIISKKSISGLLISGIFILLNLFLILALLSEASEFNTFNQNYYNLIIFGSIYIGFNLLAGTLMFLKYLKHKINYV
jgi:hypothetical protein